MSTALQKKEVAGIKATAQRLTSEGYPITEYSLRRAVKEGRIPAREVGRKVFVSYTNVLKWLTCENGQDNMPTPTVGGIRPVV